MAEKNPETKNLPPFIGVHFSSEDPFRSDMEHQLDNRGDTLVMPNAGIGVLLARAEKEGIERRKVYDTTFPGELQTIEAIEKEVDELIKIGETPRIFASVLSYNAEASIKFLEKLKSKYGDKIITGVGGQLIGRATKAYIANPYIDIVGVGDAEVIFRPMMQRYQEQTPTEFKATLTDEKMRTDLVARDPNFIHQDVLTQKSRIEKEKLRQLGEYKVVAGWLVGINKRKKRQEAENFTPLKYDLPSYDPERYAFIKERKEAMQEVVIGPKKYGVSGIVMLLSEFGRQCDWAGNAGACSFCALIGVEDPRNFQDTSTYIQHLVRLKQLHPDLNWIFDVSNQLLEQNKLQAIKFLTRFTEEREKHPELKDVKTYAYLTITNISKETAPLLKRCGIDVVYVGLESFDPEQWKIQNKANNEDTVERCFKAAQKYGIKIRTSLVLGINTSEASLKKEVIGLEKAMQEYPDLFLTIGVHKVEMLPGSRDFANFKLENEKLYHDPVVSAIYHHFDEKGWLDRDQQVGLTKAFIEWRSKIHALGKEYGEFQNIFENFVGIKKPKSKYFHSLTRSKAHVVSLLQDPFEREKQEKYLSSKLRYAKEQKLGITYEQIETYAERLEQIIQRYGVIAHTLEKGSLTE
ncbi:MAG TPA: radical SAM protein [Patescibacteria group bacterium]|nr:radical SAM protein [Patescibacteria group bacterium]